MAQNNDPPDYIMLTRLMRLNATIYGIVLGIIFGATIFIATNWLVLKGGPIGPAGDPVIGPHLWLLGQYFFGYGVTFVGSIVGFAYGFGVGFIIGYFFAALYNWLVALKESGQAKIKIRQEKSIRNKIHETKSSPS